MSFVWKDGPLAEVSHLTLFQNTARCNCFCLNLLMRQHSQVLVQHVFFLFFLTLILLNWHEIN